MQKDLSRLFVNPLGLLCLETDNYSVIDVGLNVSRNFRQLGPVLIEEISIGFTPNVLSIYEDREFTFRLAQKKYGLFENEEYVPGLYSQEYVLSLIDEIRNFNLE